MSLSVEEEVKNMESLITLGFGPTCQEDNWLSLEADIVMLKKHFDACRHVLKMEDISEESFVLVEKVLTWLSILQNENIAHGICAFLSIDNNDFYARLSDDQQYRLVSTGPLSAVVLKLSGPGAFLTNVDWDDLHEYIKPYYVEEADVERFQALLNKRYDLY